LCAPGGANVSHEARTGGRRPDAQGRHGARFRWTLIAACASAAWSAAVLVALAVTGDEALVAWWALGTLAILVAAISVWTEQTDGEPDDGSGGESPRPPPTPPSDWSTSDIDLPSVARDMARWVAHERLEVMRCS
jgi:hypothetical protein